MGLANDIIVCIMFGAAMVPGLLLLPKGIFSPENVQINNKCYDTGQTQGFTGLLHAIVRNFVQDLVTGIKDVTIDGVSLSFFFGL